MRRTIIGGLVVAMLLGALVAATFANRFAAPDSPAVHDLFPNTGPYTHRAYVLDIGRRGGRIVAVHPETPAAGVARRYPVGVQAQTALSPDGSRLYALSFWRGSRRQVMTTFDTASGDLFHEAPIEAALPTGWSTEQYALWPQNDGLVSSPDGARLYFAERSYTRHHEHDSVWLGTYDTIGQRLLPEAAEIRGCDIRSILPQDRGRVVVACSRNTNCCYEAYSETSDVRFLTIASDGSAAASDTVPLEPPAWDDSFDDHAGALAWAVPSPDRRRVYAVTRTGRLFVIDVRDETVDRVVDLELVGSAEVTGQNVALSRDGRTLYVGTSGVTQVTKGIAQHIQSFDVSTWRRTGGVRAGLPFLSLGLAPGGEYLYALSPRTYSHWGRARRRPALQVFDADTLAPVGVVSAGWHNPVLAEVPFLDAD